jgi:DNA-binding transcriptional ArsR family regulator
MFKDKLNKTELKILKFLLKNPMTISQLADAIGVGLPWISRNVNHLRALGFISARRKGNSIIVEIINNSLGDSFAALISEEPMLNIERILAGSGLRVLPLLLNPGNSADEIVLRSSLSLRTVKGLLSLWRKMGVVSLTKRIYVISDRHKPLINFVKYYSYHMIIRLLKKSYPDAAVVWHWRDEFIFSIDRSLKDKRFISAATTRLNELKYDIIASKEYYFHNPMLRKMCDEEALVQSFLLNPENPRIPRLLTEAMKKGRIDKGILLELSRKYGLKKKIEEVI